MTILSICNASLNVWAIDTGTTWPPVLQVSTDGQCNSIAALPDGFVYVRGTGINRQIFRKTGAVESLVHEISDGSIRYVRVRDVSGEKRIYFMVVSDGPSYSIYYIKDQSAVLYYTVNIQDLGIPHPCSADLTLHFYAGDFTFGSNDTLYLSSGNLLANEVGIFQVSGAGPDSVTGSVSRIYLGQGPIEYLCYLDPNTLYFARLGEIVSMDLSTKVVKYEYDSSQIYLKDISEEIPTALPYYRKVLITPILWWWEKGLAILRNLAWGRAWKGPSGKRAF